jgi:hypothetical protein
MLVASAINNTDEYTRVSAVTTDHDAVTVLWKTTDLILFPSDVGTSRWNAAQTMIGFPQQDSHNSTQETEGTSEAARIGIGVGIAVPFCLFLLGVLVWVRKRRQRHAELARKPELDSNYTSVWKRYMGDAWRAELDTDTQDEAWKLMHHLGGECRGHRPPAFCRLPA